MENKVASIVGDLMLNIVYASLSFLHMHGYNYA